MRLLDKPLLLCGFMGCGKTTYALRLHEKLNFQLISIDEEIKRQHRCSIGEIFKKNGEEAFREYEHKALQNALEAFQTGKSNLLVDGGGGLVLQEKNKILLKNFTVVFINTDFEKIIVNLSNSGERPLLNELSDIKIFSLWKKRQKGYAEAADHTVKTENELLTLISSL